MTGQTQPVDFEDARSTVDATYVEPSATEPLRPGSKVAGLFALNLTTPYYLQRLTDRTYMFGGGFYTTTFYVGDQGVLVFDPPENQGEHLRQAIADVTALPVTAIVYSHNHADHIIGAPPLLEAANAAGVDVRIIASTETATKMELLKSGLARPTETVAWPDGAFQFEGLAVELHGFQRAAHTDDAAALLLVQERVAHLPDLVNGDQPPFRNFSQSENCVYFRSNVDQLGALDWTHLVGGHGNIASKDDIRFYNAYLDDLDEAVAKAMATTQFGDAVDMSKVTNNHAQLMVQWLDAVVGVATAAMRPTYGAFYGFDITTPANAEMLVLSMISYR